MKTATLILIVAAIAALAVAAPWVWVVGCDSFEVVKVDGYHRETVWSYDHAQDQSRLDPVRKWGYDVTRTWSGPARPATRPSFGRLQQRRT